MPKVIFVTWNPGLRKISLTNLLQSKAHIPLAEAKEAVDRFLDGQTISVHVATSDEAGCQGQLKILQDAPLAIVTKVFVKAYDPEDPWPYRVEAAVGHVQPGPGNSLMAEHCFVTLYYNHQCEMSTIDFHREFA